MKSLSASPIDGALLPFRLRVYSLILSVPSNRSEGGCEEERLGEAVVEHAREGFRSQSLSLSPSPSWLALQPHTNFPGTFKLYLDAVQIPAVVSHGNPGTRSWVERQRSVAPWSETWARCGGADASVGLADWEAIRGMHRSTREVGDCQRVLRVVDRCWAS